MSRMLHHSKYFYISGEMGVWECTILPQCHMYELAKSQAMVPHNAVLASVGIQNSLKHNNYLLLNEESWHFRSRGKLLKRAQNAQPQHECG